MTKKPIVYAFIDSQNLNLGVQSQGWKLNFIRFRTYLMDKYKVDKAFLFLGYIKTNQKLYDYLSKANYHLIFKQVIDIKGKTKGNVDAELIVWTMKSVYEKLCDQVIVVSGDGDFAILAQFLLDKKVLAKFIAPNYKTMSVLIKRIFIKRKKMNLLTFLNDLKNKLAKK